MCVRAIVNIYTACACIKLFTVSLPSTSYDLWCGLFKVSARIDFIIEIHSAPERTMWNYTPIAEGSREALVKFSLVSYYVSMNRYILRHTANLCEHKWFRPIKWTFHCVTKWMIRVRKQSYRNGRMYLSKTPAAGPNGGFSEPLGLFYNGQN